MTNRNTDPSQRENTNNPQPPPDHSRGGNKVYKSGPLFLSSKGIGWTSWKKRWFILTRTSLVFFRSDPTAIPQKGSEVNLTLGGIDLNSSGSVVVKSDKKLLTVLFPDGRDGRAFTLKAETSEDLYEWKAALDEALANATSTALVTGQNGIFRNDPVDIVDSFLEQSKDRQPVKSLVIGRPILLALEDIDGTPSFLEKALRFIEEHGVKVEGILRQAADVDDVELRVQEYEQGKSEFSTKEDPHVIADCVKYVLRELPSSPVPESCCKALLEACRTERGMRVTAMRAAICETFPEPNRRLLQRILMMMQTVASHKSENLMSTSAVAACMAPLLLRPLLAGDCELQNNFDMGGDGSFQLLQAAAAANHAQSIVITLLEEYDNLFGDGGSLSPGIYSNSEESGSEFSDDDGTFEDDDDDASECSDEDVDEDFGHMSSGICSETGDTRGNLYNQKGSERSTSGSKSHEVVDRLEDNKKLSPSPPQTPLPQHNSVEGSEIFPNQANSCSTVQANESGELLGEDPVETSSIPKPTDKRLTACIQTSMNVSNGPVCNIRRPTVWGRTPAKKKMEAIVISSEDEAEIQRLEAAKTGLQNRVSEEAKKNAILRENLEKHKNALHVRRLALEQDVARLRQQLQKERELTALLEAGLKMSHGPLPVSTTNEKIKAELEEIAQAEEYVVNLKQKGDDLGVQLYQQREQIHGLSHNSFNQTQQAANYQGKTKDKQKDSGKTAASCTLEKSRRCKDTHLDKVDTDKYTKQESPSLPNKHPPRTPQSDPARNSKSSVEPGMGKPVSINSKQSGSRGEGSNSTSSALSKLSNRLNFLKELRSQISNELQNFDKGGNSGQPVQNLGKGRGSESYLSPQNMDKFQKLEGQLFDKGRGSDSYQLVQNPNKGVADSQSILDKGKMSEGLSVPNLDKGKSESFPNVEKSRSVIPPRPLSR